MNRQIDLGSKFAIAQYLDFIGRFGDACLDQRLDVKGVFTGFFHQFLQHAQIQGYVFQAVDIFKSALGQTPLHGGLAAFEVALEFGTAPGFVAFVAACRRAAPAGTLAATDAFTRFDRTLSWT